MVENERTKILVVDDEAGIRDFFCGVFPKEVSIATNGEAAIDLVEKEKFDVILLDIKLPDIDGIETLRRIKKIDEDAVVIMLTAYAEVNTAIAALKEGAYDYVTKPFVLDEIIATVKRALERKRLVTENKQLVKKLEQKVVVAEKRLEITTKKLEDTYAELKDTYRGIVYRPVPLWQKIKAGYLKYMSWLVLPSLIGGILAAKYSPAVLKVTDTIMSKLIDSIMTLAPLAIFIVLAPSVAKILKTRKESKFAGFIVLWFSVTRILAAVWAALFVSVALGLPILPQEQAGGMMGLLLQNFRLLGKMLFTTTFFRAMWISIIIGIIAYYNKRLYRWLEKGAQSIEVAGEYIEPWIPLFAFLIGGFIYGLPKTLLHEIPPDVLAGLSQGVTLMGININLRHEFGLVGVYFVEAILIGVGCTIWQVVELLIMKKMVQGFSIKSFLTKYWLKVYPLAWSTASEAISMPLNMALIKRRYKDVSDTVRRLVVGLGGYLNVNGTSMDVMMLTGVVSIIVGHPASLLALLISVPIIALIGYGVPGIAGEEILFVVPMMKIVGIPEPVIGAFLAIFCAIQMGLPDSFRTGANVTDNGIYAIGLNRLYERRFKGNKAIEKQS
jgi:CheY-like chemotaxis protein/Na+/H+-dicarboxylate symporter